MTETPAIRPMRWWDIDAAAALEERLFTADAWTAAAFWSELAQHESRYYVVIAAADRVLGYAGLLAVPGGPDAEVLTVAVDPAEQGHGWGGRLLRCLLTEANRRRCATVVLEVRAGNSPAVTLYRRHGFEQLSRRRRYYADGADAIVMRRREGTADVRGSSVAGEAL